MKSVKDINFISRIAGFALLLAVGFGFNQAAAEIVTQKQASKIAETFFNAAYGEYMVAPKLEWNGRQLTTNRLFSPFYVYNHPKGGFVIIAADNKAFPILAYSKTARFNKDTLGEAEKGMMNQFAREVELIRYDDRSPDRAIAAWQNLPLYINKILNNPYDTPDFWNLTDEQRDNIEAIDRRNNWVIMPTAVEFPIYNPDRYRDYTLDDVLGEEEEVPFSFYEDFIAEIEKEKRTRAIEFDEIISPTKPVVNFLGGAHYAIRFPENVHLARIYDINGSRMMEKYFKNTNTVNLDLSSLPGGYYILLTLSDDGHVNGIKLPR